MRMVMEGLKGFYSNNVSRWLLTLGALVVAMMMTEPSRARMRPPPCRKRPLPRTSRTCLAVPTPSSSRALMSRELRFPTMRVKATNRSRPERVEPDRHDHGIALRRGICSRTVAASSALGTFFSEGWNEAWAGTPAGQGGTPDPWHGWLECVRMVCFSMTRQ